MTSNDFITIKQGIILTGKSDSTIRNLIKSLSKGDKDRYVKRNSKGRVLISKSFLASQYGTIKEEQGNQDEIIKELVFTLKEQLREKNEQIRNYQQIEKLQLINDLLNKGISHDSIMKVLGMSEGEMIKILDFHKK